MSFCFLYNVVSENHSVQNSPWGGEGGLLPAQGLYYFNKNVRVYLRNNFFLIRELSLINTCCWRADHAILIHDGASRSELIFVSARQHMC